MAVVVPVDVNVVLVDVTVVNVLVVLVTEVVVVVVVVVSFGMRAAIVMQLAIRKHRPKVSPMQQVSRGAKIARSICRKSG